MTIPIDHEFLDLIFRSIPSHLRETWMLSRESECLEFSCPRTGNRCEVVVRPIDDDEDDGEDGEDFDLEGDDDPEDDD